MQQEIEVEKAMVPSALIILVLIAGGPLLFNIIINMVFKSSLINNCLEDSNVARSVNENLLKSFCSFAMINEN